MTEERTTDDENILADGIGFYSRPQLEELSDGSWRGQYPAMDWSVTADSREAAIQNLQTEDLRRAQEDPNYMIERYKALRRHLVEPIPGIYAYSREEGERMRASEDPEAEFIRYADKMDAETDDS